MSSTPCTVAKRPPTLVAGAVIALAAMLVALLPPTPFSASEAVPSDILAEDAQAPLCTYLYDFTGAANHAGSGFDDLYARDPFNDDRILPGELCAYAARGSEGAECIDLVPEGFRFRRSSTRLLPKKPFTIRWDDRIQGPKAFTACRDATRGQSRLNANAMWTDPSMMRERLAMAMLETTEQPGPQTRRIALQHNDVPAGLSTHVQRIDQNLARDLETRHRWWLPAQQHPPRSRPVPRLRGVRRLHRRRGRRSVPR